MIMCKTLSPKKYKINKTILNLHPASDTYSQAQKMTCLFTFIYPFVILFTPDAAPPAKLGVRVE